MHTNLEGSFEVYIGNGPIYFRMRKFFRPYSFLERLSASRLSSHFAVILIDYYYSVAHTILLSLARSYLLVILNRCIACGLVIHAGNVTHDRAYVTR